MTTDLHQPAQ